MISRGKHNSYVWYVEIMPRPPAHFFGTFGQQEKEDRGAVEIDERDIPVDDREPEFKSKVDEAIWRLKNQ